MSAGVEEKLRQALAAQRAAVPEGTRFAPWLCHFTDKDIAAAAAACDPDPNTTSLIWWREAVAGNRPWATRAAEFVYAAAVAADGDPEAALALSAAPPPDARAGYQRMILEKLFLHPEAYADIDKSIRVGIELEKVLYNRVIRQARLEGVIARWTGDDFSSLAGGFYGEACRIIDPQSRVCAERGARLGPRLLAVDSVAQVKDLPLTEDENYPEVFARDRQAIAEQRSVRVEKIYSELYKCGACGMKTIIVVEAQVRSLDEGKTVQCVCDTCGNKFAG